MTSHAFADKFATIKNFKAFLLSGFDLNNRECYYVVACPPHKVEYLQQNDISNLDECSKVLASGFGKAPPAAEQEMLKETYNVEF